MHSVTRRVVTGHYDLVVLTNRVSVRAVGATTKAASQPAYEAGYARVLRAFAAAGLRVVVIRDTPASGYQVAQCIAAHPRNYAACDGTRAGWLPGDPSIAAVKTVDNPRITSTDLTDYLCRKVVCPVTVGGVIIYRDHSHLTATYAATLEPYLRVAIDKALRA